METVRKALLDQYNHLVYRSKVSDLDRKKYKYMAEGLLDMVVELCKVDSTFESLKEDMIIIHEENYLDVRF